MTISPELQKAFQFHIRNATRRYVNANCAAIGPAKWALDMARRDVAEGKRRYPSGYRSGNGVTLQPDQAGMAYVDKPESVGLRLVGEVSIEFRRGPFNRNAREGYLTDPYGDTFKDGTGLAWGVVYQLPGKDGQSRFVAGYQFGGIEGGPTLDLSRIYVEPRADWEISATDCDAATDAARAADSMAQHAAEEEREYQTAWAAGSRYSDESESVATAKAELRALLAERRKVKGAEGFPALCGAIKRQVSTLLEEVSKARERMRLLVDGDSPDLIFWNGEKRLQEAFCEGAGLQAFPS